MKIDIEKLKEKLHDKMLFFRLANFKGYRCCLSCLEVGDNIFFYIYNGNCYYVTSTSKPFSHNLKNIDWDYFIKTIELNPDLIDLWDIRDCVTSEEE